MPGWLYVPAFLAAWCAASVLLAALLGRVFRAGRHHPTKPTEGGPK